MLCLLTLSWMSLSCISLNTVTFYLQIKACVLEINNKFPTGGGNVFIENERGTRKCISGS